MKKTDSRISFSEVYPTNTYPKKNLKEERCSVILNTLDKYQKGESVKLLLGSEIFDDFKIVGYNKKDDTFTVERIISNGKVTKRVKKEILDYYNNRGYTIGEEVFIKVKGKYLQGKITGSNEKKCQYLVEWTDESGKNKKNFSVSKLNSYNNYIHQIGTDEYLFPGEKGPVVIN